MTKSHASRHAFVFGDDVVADIAADYPDVTLDRVLVDAAAACFVMRPETFDVVVGFNLSWTSSPTSGPRFRAGWVWPPA